MKEKQNSGAETTFTDKNGVPICVHSYVKDEAGNRYFINSHSQAVPDGEDAPAQELSRLLESTSLTVMTADEVLKNPQKETVRRRGRRRALIPAESASPEKKEAEAAPREEEKVNEDLLPVSMEIVLTSIPDNVLAHELRRRGYSICAVKPAFIQI